MELPDGGGTLRDLVTISGGWRLEAQVVALTDVTTPLTGADGAAAVFGPQKGATRSEVEQLSAGLGRLAECLARVGHPGMEALPGGGAAGGRGWGSPLLPGPPRSVLPGCSTASVSTPLWRLWTWSSPGRRVRQHIFRRQGDRGDCAPGPGGPPSRRRGGGKGAEQVGITVVSGNCGPSLRPTSRRCGSGRRGRRSGCPRPDPFLSSAPYVSC